ncbi:unnamed protein product [Musa acuminata subsp. burmannicoides]
MDHMQSLTTSQIGLTFCCQKLRPGLSDESQVQRRKELPPTAAADRVTARKRPCVWASDIHAMHFSSEQSSWYQPCVRCLFDLEHEVTAEVGSLHILNGDQDIANWNKPLPNGHMNMNECTRHQKELHFLVAEKTSLPIPNYQTHLYNNQGVSCNIFHYFDSTDAHIYYKGRKMIQWWGFGSHEQLLNFHKVIYFSFARTKRCSDRDLGNTDDYLGNDLIWHGSKPCSSL